MLLTKQVVDVVGDVGDSSKRQLLALVATAAESDTSDAEPAPPLGRFDDVIVYLHGFPDMAVHPTKLAFASRLPLKIADAWLGAASGRRRALVAFNFGGVPGSDRQLRFTDKTVAKELEDAVAVCQFVRRNLLDVGGVRSDGRAKLHVVGLSTGAIVASLLRNKRVADTIAVIAGLLDAARGVAYDFSPLQLAQFEHDGACWKEFYLPEGSPLSRNVPLSLDGETQADLSSGVRTGDGSEEGELDSEETAPHKLFIRLGRAYVDECRSGELDIQRAVSLVSPNPHLQSPSSASSLELPPFLVIHGDADQNVPLHNGEELFAAASEPKRFLRIPRANHLLSNSKHLKKALQAIVAHTSSS